MLESEAMAILVGAGVSYGRREAALRAAGSALAILAEPGLYAAQLQEKGLALLRHALADEARLLDGLAKKKMALVLREDAQYPPLLRQIAHPPHLLYVYGETDLTDRFPVAVVGTRRASAYGLTHTREIAAELAQTGVCVVSGLALGIDAAAHTGALDGGGRTVAVLGGALDKPYPQENEPLMRRILESGGSVVSEYAPGTPPSRYSFLQRNRIIAGMSLGTLVTEGPRRSGALNTATRTLESGREVFALPGNVDSPGAQLPNMLISEGARLVTGAADILSALVIEPKDESKAAQAAVAPMEAPAERKPHIPGGLDETQRAICAALLAGEADFDALCAVSGLESDELGAAIVKEQSVDAATSATASITLGALRKAAANCVAQAKSEASALIENAAEDDGDWLGVAPEIAESQIASTLSTDLLIVGAGNGGMMAAVTAADAGMDFILAEQNTVMGDTRHWIGAIDTDAMKAAGVEIKKDQVLNELARYASYKVDMSVIKMWIDKSAEMVSYLESLGMKAEVHIAPESHVGGNNMNYYVPSQWHTINLPEGCEQKDRHAFLEKHLNDKGYQISYSMTLVRLVQDEAGKVTGAIFTNAAGEYVKVNANNVILATGGYPGNPKMIKALAPIVAESVTANSYFAANTGMGIRAGIWAGAKMDSTDAPMIFDRGIVPPGAKAGYVKDANGNEVFPSPMGQFIIGTQPYLKVNKEGLRFANESCPYDFFNHAASLQTDGVYAAILDSDVTEDIITYDQFGCAQIAVNIAQGGGIIPMLESQIEAGLVFKADTIEELAQKMGLPADTLAATVARYNELAAKGLDEDFGKEAYRLRAVDHAPYYGYFMGGSLLCTCDGLRINDKCQVYDTNHKVIDGLYAIGNCSGSFFAGNYPEYFVGVAVGRTMTQGRQAVKAILGEC